MKKGRFGGMLGWRSQAVGGEVRKAEGGSVGGGCVP